MRQFSKQKRPVKIVLVLITLLLLVLSLTLPSTATYAEDSQTIEEDLEEELGQEIDNQLGNLDLSSLEDILNSLTDGELAIFGSNSFIGKLQDLINGNFEDGTSLWSALLNLFFENIFSFKSQIGII